MKSAFVSFCFYVLLVVPNLRAMVPYPSLGLKSNDIDIIWTYLKYIETHSRGFSLCTTRSWPCWCLLAWVLPWDALGLLWRSTLWAGPPVWRLCLFWGKVSRKPTFRHQSFASLGAWRFYVAPPNAARLCKISVSCDSCHSAQAPWSSLAWWLFASIDDHRVMVSWSKPGTWDPCSTVGESGCAGLKSVFQSNFCKEHIVWLGVYPCQSLEFSQKLLLSCFCVGQTFLKLMPIVLGGTVCL